MTKKEVQQRVLQDGKPLDIDKFEWDEKTNTFSSDEDELVIDFKGVSGCIFKTGWDCTFNTGSGCTFDTGSYCTFKTGADCTFKTSSGCTFRTGWNCTFDTEEECVVVRRDVYEVIELDRTQKIKLNEYGTNGYEVVTDKHTITIDGKDIEIGKESFQALKDKLLKEE
jgi:hypothetical protein